jgi:hypothetical protein
VISGEGDPSDPDDGTAVGDTPPPVPDAPAAPPASGPRPAPVRPNAPPVTPPTPASRAGAVPKEKKAKLKANEKVERYCRAMGKNLNSYLLELEARGMTQEQLDGFAQSASPRSAATGRKSVYDHSDD